MTPIIRHVSFTAIAVLGVSGGAWGAASATFQPVGNLVQARDSEQATLLADGTVLVTGGYHNSVDLGTAELFDPTTSQFTALPALASPRGEGHRAVRLQDGSVLVTGGFNGESSLGSAELFDPSLHSWKPVGDMTLDRGDHTATRLLDGRVLVAGGWSYSLLGPTASAELFDPAQGTFEKTGALTIDRYRHAAVALPDGRVAVLGGYGPGNEALSRVEIYDPKAGTFTARGSLVQARGDMTAALLPDGRILVVGGAAPQATFLLAINSVEIYDPATGQSQVTGAMTDARALHAAAPLPDGRLLVAGGGNGLDVTTALRTAAVVDPTTGKVSPTASMAAARLAPAAVSLLDGRVLIIGGAQSDLTSLNTAEVYIPAAAIKPGP